MTHVEGTGVAHPVVSGWSLVRARARLADTVVSAVAVLLAGSCLIPLFTDLRWIPSALVVVAVVALLGAGSRALGLPIPFVPLAQALGLLGTLVVIFAGSSAWAGVVPTSQSWSVMQALARQGILDAQTFMAPVIPFPGLVLLAVGAIGLVALSTDTLFVSVRMPLLAGLPLLATYVVTAIVLSGQQPWWTLPAAGTGWLLILAADQRDRVREWGDLPETTRIRGLSAGARRIGVLAVAAAAVTTVALPAAASNPWSTVGDGSGGGTSANGTPVILDPLVSMRRNLVQASDTEVLTYRTQTPNPSYLRIAALESFDGTTWRPREGLASGRDAGVPLPGDVLSAAMAADSLNRVTGGDSFTYEIDVTNLENSYLPLPYPITDIEDAGGLGADWRLDPTTGTAFSDDVAATGLAYTVAALDPRIEPGQLSQAQAATGDLWPFLQLPGGLSPRIDALATQVTASATTPYEKAMALQKWFTRDGGFQYSTDVRSGADADYIAEFLDQRIGYCEQFAGAMAIMARTLGIPSRVVVGFTQGSQSEDGTWHVTVRDAHAWPELWFDGVGWARFEPTPRSGGTVQTPAYARTPDVGTVGGEAIEQRVPQGLDAVDATGASGSSVADGVRQVLGGIAVLLLIVGLVAGIATLLWPMGRRIVHRRRRLAGSGVGGVAEGAWAEVGATAIDLGQPWSASSTPRQAAERLSRGMSATGTQALRRLRQEVERTRYADPVGRRVTVEHEEAIRADARAIAAELRGRVRWQTRLAAYCWPSSERRRQRSSMRSMKPEVGLGASGLAGAASAATSPRAPKAE